MYDAEKQISGPDPVQRLGLPVNNIQAALVWGEDKTQKVYFFKGENYWRFNPQENWVDMSYARTMVDWRGIPNDIDAAFQDRYGEKNPTKLSCRQLLTLMCTFCGNTSQIASSFAFFRFCPLPERQTVLEV